jgi:hypothetical protein
MIKASELKTDFITHLDAASGSISSSKQLVPDQRGRGRGKHSPSTRIIFTFHN